MYYKWSMNCNLIATRNSYNVIQTIFMTLIKLSCFWKYIYVYGWQNGKCEYLRWWSIIQFTS